MGMTWTVGGCGLVGVSWVVDNVCGCGLNNGYFLRN